MLTYDESKAVIREAFLASPELVALVGDRIYPSRDEMGENPQGDSITLGREGGGYSANNVSDDAQVKVDIWSRRGNDGLWEIYNIVRQIMHSLPSQNAAVFYCRETYVNDNLYEEKLKLSHLASRYKFIKRR
jgi:hypothetical protein